MFKLNWVLKLLIIEIIITIQSFISLSTILCVVMIFNPSTRIYLFSIQMMLLALSFFNEYIIYQNFPILQIKNQIVFIK